MTQMWLLCLVCCLMFWSEAATADDLFINNMSDADITSLMDTTFTGATKESSSKTYPVPPTSENVIHNSTNDACQCVSYYLCDTNRTIIENGQGLIDIRGNFDCDDYMETCCASGDILENPIPVPPPVTLPPLPPSVPTSIYPYPSPDTYSPSPNPSPDTNSPYPNPSPDTNSPYPNPSPDTYSPYPNPSPDTNSPSPNPSPDTNSPYPNPSPDTYSPYPNPSPDTNSPYPNPSPDTNSPYPNPSPDTNSPYPNPSPDTNCPYPNPSSNTPTNCVNPLPTPQPGSCGKRNDFGVGFRMIGNENHESEFGEFPWMVAIIKRDHIGGDQVGNVYQCGGSLLNPRVVLTAAHCVKGKTDLIARVGEWDTQRTNEPLPTQSRDISRVIIHEQFHTGALHNDVALLFLDSPVELAPNVGTICLPEQDENMVDRNCIASGWGKDSFGQEGKYQVILKKVELQVVEQQTCQEKLRTTRLGPRFRLHQSFLCAGGVPGQDTCKGDGGSPLVCPSKSNPNVYVQAGIVAWGIGCNTAVPGVYVDVAKFRNWIDDQISNANIDERYLP